MKIINKITFISGLFFLLFSCAPDDWLEPRPLSFYAPENIYVNEQGFEALLVTIKKDVKSEHYHDRSYMVNEY
ncbi:MAG: hypothetical protein PHH93_08770, partial [Prolixibacteraceae bacterium]|nr:hypothetical protein [Prolixibacteraceae bacterium]